MRVGDRGFFNLFETVCAASNSDRESAQWSVAGVRWHRQKHIFRAELAYQLELHMLEKVSGKRPWRLLVVHEIWWGVGRGKAIRNARWAHIEIGSQRDVLEWLAEREHEPA